VNDSDDNHDDSPIKNVFRHDDTSRSRSNAAAAADDDDEHLLEDRLSAAVVLFIVIVDLVESGKLTFGEIDVETLCHRCLFQYDSSQSPLALLAQTCSSIGKDCPSPPLSMPLTSAPPIITSLVGKASSNPSSTSNQDKSLLSTKRSSSSSSSSSSSTPFTSTNVHRKSTGTCKPAGLGNASPFVESHPLSSHLPSLYDPSTAASLLLRSSLAYLAAQQQQQQQQQHSYSTACTIPGCLQCETVRHILAASAVNNQPYACHWYSCNGRFSSSDELVEHIQHNHRSSKVTNHQRFQPYAKPSMLMINNNDQLPFFYPHLSLSPMTGSTRRMNNNTDNNN
jgi:hypothetical protein